MTRPRPPAPTTTCLVNHHGKPCPGYPTQSSGVWVEHREFDPATGIYRSWWTRSEQEPEDATD